MPNDTTTALNPTSAGGGDSMDESLVTQSDGVTKAKRPRVVLGGDIAPGAVVDLVMVDGRWCVPVDTAEIAELLGDIRTELRTITFFLQTGLNVSDEPERVRSDPSVTNR